jgi:hypothetical protein
MKDGLDPYVDKPVPMLLKVEIMMARAIESLSKPHKEFLSITAKKLL